MIGDPVFIATFDAAISIFEKFCQKKVNNHSVILFPRGKICDLLSSALTWGIDNVKKNTFSPNLSKKEVWKE